MSLFRNVNPKFILYTGVAVFFIGLALAFTSSYKPLGVFYFAGSFAMIVWASIEFRRQRNGNS